MSAQANDSEIKTESVPQTTVENVKTERDSAVKLPPNAKVILPAEKVTPAVKKERSEAQKEAFKKMRAARDEANKRRQFSRKEALEKIDEMKEEERKQEEEAMQRKAKELAEATGAAVVVQKKRGRKPGEKIPYGGKQNPNLNIDAPSPPMSAVYNQPIEKQPHYKAPSGNEHSVKAPNPITNPVRVPAAPPKPVVVAPSGLLPHSNGAVVYENPYLEMIRRKRR